MPDEKPKPEAFAKHVLWYLAGIQAQLQQIEGQVAFLTAKGDYKMVEKIIDQSVAERLKMQEEIFADAVKQSVLDAGSQGTPPSPRA